MLFAAGRGTRMGALTQDRPKPLIPVAGRALIDHALAQIDSAGIERIVANLHHKPEMIQAHLNGRNVAFSAELETLLETGGGLRQALPLLGPGPVFTLNTDAVWTSGTSALSLLRDAWDPGRMEALLLLVPRPRAHGHTGPGDFLMSEDGRLRRGPGLIYTGAQIVTTERLADIDDPVFSLNRLWDQMLAAGTLYGCLYDGHWADVGRPDGIDTAEAMVARHDV